MPPQKLKCLDFVMQLDFNPVGPLFDACNRRALVSRKLSGLLVHSQLDRNLYFAPVDYPGLDLYKVRRIRKGNACKLHDDTLLRHFRTPLEVFLTTRNFGLDINIS